LCRYAGLKAADAGAHSAAARFYLPDDVNTKVDRASGVVGLEVRVPFLDTALVDFACRLPPHLRLRWRSPKYILK
jgi:asparagine synthase (glutamine-hydrolysing)